ncbi:MAG: OmpH family outer membrane protein [Verrucomicrobiota bacterium]
MFRAFLFLIPFCLIAQSQAEELIGGMVDFPKIQRHYYRTAMEQKAITEKREEAATKLEETLNENRAKIEELLKAQQDAQKQLDDPTLSAAKKEETLKAAQDRAAEINKFQTEVQQQQLESRNALIQQADSANVALLNEINDAIRTVAEKNSVDFVMNQKFGLSGIPTFPYVSARKILDLTDEVIAKLNQSAPEGWVPGQEDEGESEE